VLRRFEPEKLMQRLEKENPISAAIPVQRQAKLWAKFEELYDVIEDEVEEDFNRLFRQAFVKAYDEQIEKLSK
jgi:predicted component of type VI protein secretion system